MKDQTDLARELGITIECLRELRKSSLAETVHWTRDPEDLRRVVITPQGEDELRRLIGAGAITAAAEPERCADPSAAEKPAPCPADGVPVREAMVVVSIPRPWGDGSIRHCANPRLVQCRRPSGEVVWVRVADCRNFVPTARDGNPMTITAEFGGQPAHWYHVGRCPRWRGKY